MYICLYKLNVNINVEVKMLLQNRSVSGRDNEKKRETEMKHL